MTTESQHAAAIALFSVIAERTTLPKDREDVFDLYEQCVAVMTGQRVPLPGRTRSFRVACSECAAELEVTLPVG